MPKRKGFLYEWMCDKEHIREAIVFGAKDKHDRRDVRRVLADVDGYTDRVYDLLQTQTFAPAQPKKRKIFDNSSRKWREIEYVPFFPDGIVHTLMVLAAAPVFLRGMNYWCCASVPGRGGKHALRRCKRVIHHDKKGSRYVCKMDVHHFYHSVDRRKLIWMLAHKIKDKKYLKLTWEILQTCEQGLAIGFFICQWLANFYLEPLDRYITTLDGVKYSVRYMDDILSWSSPTTSVAVSRLKPPRQTAFRSRTHRTTWTAPLSEHTNKPLAWQKCHVRGFLFCAALAARYAVFISAH